jgi:hypothetical protein
MVPHRPSPGFKGTLFSVKTASDVQGSSAAACFSMAAIYRSTKPYRQARSQSITVMALGGGVGPAGECAGTGVAMPTNIETAAMQK